MVTGCVSISASASLVGISSGIASFANRIKICTITAVIKKYKALIKKKKKRHNEIAFLAKPRLNTVDILISKALFDSCINHNKFVSIKNVLKEYDNKKEKRKSPNNNIKWIFIVLNAQSLQKITILK